VKYPELNFLKVFDPPLYGVNHCPKFQAVGVILFVPPVKKITLFHFHQVATTD
jgi:hypothetical protein